LQAQKKDQS